jgi:hypothetical protein
MMKQAYLCPTVKSWKVVVSSSSKPSPMVPAQDKEKNPLVVNLIWKIKALPYLKHFAAI